ncbi:MAG: hypothetical protein Q8908_13155 [Bacteroidota bacterium]|nr:hypothetical protein [Bacteroidota bacterium]
MQKILFLSIIVLLFFSCKKAANNHPGSSQLWVKVSDSVPDLNINFNRKGFGTRKSDYSVSYLGKVFHPNLWTFTDVRNNDKWVLVYKSYEGTDDLSVQLVGNGNVYLAQGLVPGEKRGIEIKVNSGGSVYVEDKDISIITQIINIE